jgi:hypothetical protein
MSTTDEMMSCEEYRHAVGAEPMFDGGVEHLADCADCCAFRDQMRALDVRIAKALELDVPPLNPPDLPSIDATDNVVTLAPRRPRAKSGWFALAASVMLAAVVGVRMFTADVDDASLGAAVLAHVDHDPSALVVSSTPVSDTMLARAVPPGVAHMGHDAGLITYAKSCEINGKTVPHLVIQGEKGPVTILLMPDESVSTAQTLEGESVHGVLLPVGNGSIAIIGARDESLGRIEQSVLSSVAWST